MKISDPPHKVRRPAARKGATVGMKGGAPFKPRRTSFKGKGRQAEFREAPWDTLRDLIYKDRGA
jgi:hypothetical protein